MADQPRCPSCYRVLLARIGCMWCVYCRVEYPLPATVRNPTGTPPNSRVERASPVVYEQVDVPGRVLKEEIADVVS